MLRDDWIVNAVLVCLLIKHRALVCHEMTEIPFLMRIQGNKESFTSSECRAAIRSIAPEPAPLAVTARSNEYQILLQQ